MRRGWATIPILLILLGLMVDPGHGDEPQIADPPGELNRLADAFPSGTKLLRKDVHLIIYDTADVWADNRRVLLDRAHDAFYRTMRSDGWPVAPLRHRLVCLLFDNYDDYQRYARKTDGLTIEGSGGYYSSRTNRIAIFNNDSNPQLLEHRQAVADAQNTLARLDRAIAAAGAQGDAARAQHLRNQRARLAVQLSALVNRSHAVAGLNNIASTLHEAAHQLCYNSGLLRRGMRHPFWLSEGLATAFETTHPAADFGPGTDNRSRRSELAKVGRRGDLLPLKQLVALVEPDDQPMSERGGLYAQSWGLLHWLYTTRLEQLQMYVRRINAGEEPLSAFEQAFGPVEQLEPAWRHFVANLES